MTKSKDELVRLLKSNIKAFNSYRKETNHQAIDLSSTDLTGTNLCKADLENINLQNSELNFAYLHSANLKDSDLSGLTIGRADMTEANLTNAILSNANLTNTILYGTNLSFAKAQKVDLEGTKIREADFSNADFSDSNLCNLDLNGVNFSNTNIKGVNFSGSNLSSTVGLDKAIYDETTIWPQASNLPSGFNTKSSMKSDSDYDKTDDILIQSDLLEGQEYQFLDNPTSDLISYDVPLIDETSLGTDPDLMDFHSFDSNDLESLDEKRTESESPLPKKPFVTPKISHLAKDLKEPKSHVGPPKESSDSNKEVTDLLNIILHKLNAIEQEQIEQKNIIEEQKDAIIEQNDIIKDQKKIIKEQKCSIDEQKTVIQEYINTIDNEKSKIDELKLTVTNQQNSIDITANTVQKTQNSFERVESKLDIIAQSDLLTQIDTLLNDVAYSMKNEQDKIENKINNVYNLLESTIKTLETDTFKNNSPEIVNELYQMLMNLEANFKAEREKSDLKIVNISELIENLILSTKNIQQNIVHSENIEILDNKLNKLLELSQDTTSESQIFESFYDFEFRIQLELEKNQNKLEAIEELFKVTFQKIDNITEKVSNTTYAEDLINTITPVQNKLSEEIKEILTQVDNFKGSTEESFGQINELLKNEISIFKTSISADISSIKDQLINISNNNLDIEINETLNKVVIETNKLSQDVEEISAICQNIEKIDIIGDDVEKINNHITLETIKSNEMLSLINDNVNDIANKFKQYLNDSSIDDEMRSIIEHLMYQLNENEKTTKDVASKLSQKFDDLEIDLQMTLKDVDRRINKINSMIRNVYKALDNLTDLIIDNPKSETKQSFVNTKKPPKSLLSSLKSDEEDDDD